MLLIGNETLFSVLVHVLILFIVCDYVTSVYGRCFFLFLTGQHGLVLLWFKLHLQIQGKLVQIIVQHRITSGYSTVCVQEMLALVLELLKWLHVGLNDLVHRIFTLKQIPFNWLKIST